MNSSSKTPRTITLADQTWAREKVEDVRISCMLNIKLNLAGLCSKLIKDMNDNDYLEYANLLEHLHRTRRN
jgi:hypothetical protein